jgi:hypothetical protein
MPPYKEQNLQSRYQLLYEYDDLTTRLVKSIIPRTIVIKLCVLHSPGGTWTLEGRISLLSETPVSKPEMIKYIFECSFYFIDLPS